VKIIIFVSGKMVLKEKEKEKKSTFPSKFPYPLSPLVLENYDLTVN
jgi:hypothetical protein